MGKRTNTAQWVESTQHFDTPRKPLMKLWRVFLLIGTFAGSSVCFLPDKNAQSPSIFPDG